MVNLAETNITVALLWASRRMAVDGSARLAAPSGGGVCNDLFDVPRYAPENMPKFKNPPVSEVALAVQFDEGLVDYMQAARFWDRLKFTYPIRQEQMSRPLMSEDFSEPTPGPPIQFQVVGSPPSMPRFWFLSEDEIFLVQLQHDLLAFNWRRRTEEASYPGYEIVGERFAGALRELRDVIEDDAERPGSLVPNWCEVTYINHIGPDPGKTDRVELPRLLRGFDVPRDGSFLPQPEDAQLALRFLIPGTESPRGRLNVSASAAIRNDTRAQIWALTLTAKLRAAEGGIDAALEALDVGHEWVVKGFDDVTSEEMHQRWQTEGGPR